MLLLFHKLNPLSWIMIVFIIIILILLIYIIISEKEEATSKDVSNLSSFTNKSDVALTYIITYIIPIASLSLSHSINTLLAIIFLFFVIGQLYVKSDMIYINPILGLWYSIYEVEVQEKDRNNKVIILCHGELLNPKDLENYKLARLTPYIYISYKVIK